MTSTPSPEAFMAQPVEPDEDLVEPSAPSLPVYWGPLESIAESLSRLVEHYTADTRDGAEQREHVDELAALQREYAEIEALHDAKQALIDQVLADCSKSTSKLANKIRAVLEPVVAPPAELEADPVAGHPSHDASVEEWREYARTVGAPLDEPDALDSMNRSQIRSLLGIPQPGTPLTPSVVHS